MRSLASYLKEYAQSHQNKMNIQIHTVCVPLIVWSVLGFLHTFALGVPPWRMSHLAVIGVLSFYALFRNIRLLSATVVVFAILLLTFEVTPYLRIVSVVIFILAWIGQFYGHKIEGKKPSFMKDLLFLLIGPLWVLKKTFPHLLKLND